MQYTPFISDIELPFYSSLASLKLEHDKLDDSARKLLGLYEIRASDRPANSCRMQIHGNALLTDDVPAGFYRAEGIIKNVNRFDEYLNADKSALLNQAGKTIWDAINDGSIYSCPSLLASFIVLSFADLKKYKFSYWFAFPALQSNPSWSPKSIYTETSILVPTDSSDAVASTSRHLTSRESAALVDAVQTWRYSIDSRQHGFFLAKRVCNPVKPATESSSSLSQGPSDNDVDQSAQEPTLKWHISPLEAYESGFFQDCGEQNRFVCFADPSNYDNEPGWMLRNLLVLVQQRWKLNKVQILRYRDVHSRRELGRSKIMTLEAVATEAALAVEGQQEQASIPKIRGWERGPTGKLSGRVVDLKEYLDPKRLADQSVDLNLKLMKWRISPNLDLDTIKETKCLLLGSGTLGSYVARNLLGWGVKKITFVDNGSVSFSNPVRQPLFNFQDCLGGGAAKAIRAAEALKEIYPGVDSTGHVFSVPMAGHPIIEETKTKADFDLLKNLIEEHDVIFLLMDTRESRWLPTLMGKAAGKLVMNAALGFDTFLVMRHGFNNGPDSASGLGCYFCNDVVVPVNSVRGQTLDQQCTVTRPGVAAIASALLVELFVSVMQHPLKARAPATTSQDDDDPHPLGIVPHQIRGFLSKFSNVVITGNNYRYCSACSDTILDAYRKDDWQFVKRALNESGYIEELSGLKEIHRSAEEAALTFDFEDDSADEVA
ncbi:Autophagy protein 7 [Myotisia sp. PD_48]|nr:Autophagy protein 7 [Myotisia sp. PD_48]